VTFVPYDNYQEWTAAWFGRVPAHWTITQVRYAADIINGYPFDSSQFSAAGVPLVRIRDLGKGETETRYSGEFVEAAAITSDDVLIGMDGEFNVGRWRGNERALLNQRMCCVRGHDAMVSRFLEYLLPIPLRQLNAITFSTTVKHLSSRDVERFPLALPPADELEAIVRMLDRETAKLDTLVGDQQRLIGLLREERKALLSKYILHGLNEVARKQPHAFGDDPSIPAHWTVQPLKYLTDPTRPIMYGIVLPGPNADDGVPIVKGGDVKPGRLRLELLNRTTHAIEAGYERSRLRGGDIVYAIRGSIGEVEIVPDELTGANLTQDAARIAPADGVDVEWLLFALRTPEIFDWLESRATGATITGINIFDLKRVQIPTPPLHEQQEIALVIRQKDAQSAAIITACERIVELINEHRTALISAAVTGQIDVRGYSSSEPLEPVAA
jgi:type I restriction enzyme, S subunit